MDRYQELVDLIGTFKADFEKFYNKKNKSAGVRLRKDMALLKRKAQEIRNEVQEIKIKMAEQEASVEQVSEQPSEQQQVQQ
ncbi:MAG: histone H1 [Bacteroidetes bacterium]|nr:histone H1 [Bacteroidota bacterium]